MQLGSVPFIFIFVTDLSEDISVPSATAIPPGTIVITKETMDKFYGKWLANRRKRLFQL